jgi:hypothetical protein
MATVQSNEVTMASDKGGKVGCKVERRSLGGCKVELRSHGGCETSGEWLAKECSIEKSAMDKHDSLVHEQCSRTGDKSARKAKGVNSKCMLNDFSLTF